MGGVVQKIVGAAKERHPLFISTPNLNFVVAAQKDKDFLNSLRRSDLCTIDGVGVLLAARILKIADA